MTRPPDDAADGDAPGPSPLTMLVVLVVLLIGGWFVSIKLAEDDRLQDCVMAGRHNCVPDDTAAR
jgi:hypothetical protein